ncbi:methyltransferase domain-containing protein [Desulfarculus baarsii]
MNREKAAFFDAQVDAPWAMAAYGPDEAPKIARLRQAAAIAPGMAVLEPGCGAGRLSQLLGQWVGPTGRVLAMDISPAMVAACQRRTQNLPQVTALHLALEQYDGPPGAFQRVVCHQVFPHFDDKPLALACLRRLLAPGGSLLIVHFIDWATINDHHRKAGTVVEGDLMPPLAAMAPMIEAVGLRVDLFADDELGYLLRAKG